MGASPDLQDEKLRLEPSAVCLISPLGDSEVTEVWEALPHVVLYYFTKASFWETFYFLKAEEKEIENQEN